MTGTPKQIEWAQEIQRVAIASIRWALAEAKKDPAYNEDDPAIRSGLELWERRIRNIERCAHAWLIIDSFKTVKASNSPQVNFSKVCAEFTVSKGFYFDR